MIIDLDRKNIAITILADSQPYLLWSKGVNIIYVLRGTVHALLNGEHKTLQKAGLLLVNPMELCQISCEQGSRAIALNIPRDCLDMVGWNALDGHMDCFAAEQQAPPQTIFDELRKQLAKAVLLYLDQKPRQQIYSAMLRLLQFLRDNFPMQPAENEKLVSGSSIARLNRVLQLLHERWNENITVSELAAEIHVSPNYLSRFFNQHLNITITKYLLNLRMQAALHALADKTCSITEIAMQTGFSSAPAFIAKFRQFYGVTPKQYRRKPPAAEEPEDLFDGASENGFLSALFDYIPLNEPDAEDYAAKTIRRHMKMEISGEVRPLRNTWRKLLNFGYAREGLLASIQQQLCRAQREIGFEYVRFHGVFDDNMHFYQEDENGNPVCNFLYIDLLFDFLIGQGFKLYIELGLMPEKLKKYDIFVLNRESNYSVAADPHKWQLAIMQSIDHWIARYGRDVVRTWRFTTMGLHVPVFTAITFEEFYQHYQVSWQAVKAVDAELQFGGPGGFASIAWDQSFLTDFFSFAKENACFPDFITIQNYPHQNMAFDRDFMDISVSQEFLPTTLSGDRHFTRNLLQQLQRVLTKTGMEPRPIWMEEWNSTIWQRDLSCDTCFKSAWMAKDIVENYDEAEAFGYWLLTDFVEERGMFHQIFHGGYGLFTYNGVPKSGWQALCLLRKMNGGMLGRGEWYFATRSERQLFILLFHYCGYDHLYRYRYRRLEKADEAYRVFEKSGRLELELSLYGLAGRPHRLQRFCIGRQQGSSFDQWLRWDAPTEISSEDLQQLHVASVPAYAAETLTPEAHGECTIHAKLEPHEVQLIVIDL